MCDSVLQFEPGLASAHNLRAMVLEDLKCPEEAIAAYREALRLEPAFSDAQGNLSDLERRMKK
jgi:Tfp pilus assembly protein PilF